MSKSALGQSSASKEAHQQLIERFRELGEERWMKDCESGKTPFPKSLCDATADIIKKDIEELEQNQTSNSVTRPITYESYNDYANGVSV